MKKIYENELFKIMDTKQDYDFKYVIENKTDKKLNLYLNGLDDYLELDENDWVGLFYGDYSNDIVRCLINNDYNYNCVYETDSEV